jgi:hypothetical protein
MLRLSAEGERNGTFESWSLPYLCRGATRAGLLLFAHVQNDDGGILGIFHVVLYLDECAMG